MYNLMLMIILIAILIVSTWVNTRIQSFQVENFDVDPHVVGHNINDNSIRGVKQSLLNNLPGIKSYGYEANMLKKSKMNSIHMFANNVYSPNCCKYSGISSRDGCACLTQEQVNQLR